MSKNKKTKINTDIKSMEYWLEIATGYVGDLTRLKRAMEALTNCVNDLKSDIQNKNSTPKG